MELGVRNCSELYDCQFLYSHVRTSYSHSFIAVYRTCSGRPAMQTVLITSACTEHTCLGEPAEHSH